MNFLNNEQNEFSEVPEVTLKCVVCGHDKFSQQSAQLNTAVATFFNFDWANQSATCYICKNCGYIHWFLPTTTVNLTTKDANSEDEDSQFVPPESLGLFLKQNP